MPTLFTPVPTYSTFRQAIMDASPIAARGAAILRSLQEIAESPTADNGVVGDKTTVEDMALAFRLLSVPREGDAPAITARRATCRDIARAIHAAGHGHMTGTVEGAMPWFLCQQQMWIDSKDPRLAAMAVTARRESEELTSPF